MQQKVAKKNSKAMNPMKTEKMKEKTEPRPTIQLSIVTPNIAYEKVSQGNMSQILLSEEQECIIGSDHQ